MYRWIIAILMLGMLSGCAASSPSVSKDFAFKEGGNTGLIVMSTRMIDNDSCYGPIEIKPPMMLQYRTKRTDQFVGGDFNIRNSLIAKDFHDPDGSLQIAEVAAGQYHFSGIFYMAGPFAPVYLKDYTFEVHPNQVTYLGELTITETKCTKSDSDTGLSQATLVFKNESARDGKLFHERVPGVGDFVYQKVGKGSVVILK